MIAIMSSTYAAINNQANVQYLFDMYELQVEFSRRSISAPWPLNVPLFFVDMIGYVARLDRIREVWGGAHSSSQRIDFYLRRNMSLDRLYMQKVRGRQAYAVRIMHETRCSVTLTRLSRCLDRN